MLRGPGRGSRRRAGTDLLVVHAAFPDPSVPTTPTRPTRVGFVVSKAVGGSVVRHRVVRRLRALVGEQLGALPSGIDLVIRAQPAAAEASSALLGEALEHALSRVLGQATPAGSGS